MKFENTEVWGFEHAFRGMRNPKESWEKSDSGFVIDNSSIPSIQRFKIGENDLKLAQALIKAGSSHRKFLRQIFVSVDITAPLYWWKEFDTYKVGTVANSTSTMHKLADTPITIDCFEHSELLKDDLILWLEATRRRFIATKKKDEWLKLIVNLPESWLQKRTVTMSYENIYAMLEQRKNHKLTEWSVDFHKWALRLPYANELLFLEVSK